MSGGEEARAAVVVLDRIVFHPSNIRRNLGDLRQMTASIELHGVLQPVVLERYGDYLRVRMGHRRVTAARLAGLKKVPADRRDWAGRPPAERRPDPRVARSVLGSLLDRWEPCLRRGLTPSQAAELTAELEHIAFPTGRPPAAPPKHLELLTNPTQDHRQEHTG